MKTKTVIIVSPYFPPSSLAGVHRARHLAKYLPSHGWTPIVIRVDEAHYVERSDPALATLVPTSVEQLRTGIVSKRLARMLGIGDIGLRSFFQIKTAIKKIVADRRVDAILITGAPYYPMLLSGWVRRKLKIPVILDFQDPWVSAEGATRSRLSKGGLSHLLATLIEPYAVRSADMITSVSDLQNDQMAQRYPWLDRSRMAAIPIGGDPSDFDALGNHPPDIPAVTLNPRFINLSYVGTFMPRTEPLARVLLRAMAKLARSYPELAPKVRLHFVGTSNQPNSFKKFQVLPIALQEGVAEFLEETPQRVSFLEALHILRNSDGLLIIGSDEPHYTASKIYPALMSGRPYVSLFHEKSSAHEILRRAGGGHTLAFADLAGLQALEGALVAALHCLATNPESMGRADPTLYAAYEARVVAQEFAKVFEATM